MGTPNEDMWPGVSEMPDFGMKFPNWKPQPLPRAITKFQDEYLVDLFRKIMVLNPHRRISAKHAIQHPYFNLIESISTVKLPTNIN